MPEIIQELADRLEAQTGVKFASCLANLYRDGSDKVGWHADDEPLFGEDPMIASLSFGASRTFKVREKGGKASESVELTSGSLLIMPPGMQ